MVSVFGKFNFLDKLSKFANGQKKAEEIKQVFSHGGLYLGLVLYTAVGAKIFQELENPAEVASLNTYQALLITKREVFLQAVYNETRNNVFYRERVDELLG